MKGAVLDRPAKHSCETPEEALTYREPKQVTECRTYKCGGTYPVCPRCNITLEREYQSYCDRCGQRLNWKGFLYPSVK